MGRKRSHTRRTPKARPVGVIEIAPDGFGFVSTAEGDFFIPATKTGGALDGDTVEVAPSSRKASRGEQESHVRRPSARVVRIVSRAHNTIIGRYEVADPFGVVVPDDPRIPFDIFTMRSDNPDIPDGSIVRVRMVAYPSRNEAATGVVEDVLGMDGQPGMDIEAIIARKGLQTRFSSAAEEQASSLAVDETDALSRGYADFRDRFVFTIDPADARDFDDALSIEARPDGSECAWPMSSQWRIGVHIADVSHYVPWGSPIDLDARKRATSVYLADRVIPMLPEPLSCDVCSLVPGKTRRAFTVDMYLDENFNVVRSDFHRSLIASSARLSYEQAQCYIDAKRRGETYRDAAIRAKLEKTPEGAMTYGDAVQRSLYESMDALNRFASQRARRRKKMGGIDFERTEAKVLLDEDGRPSDVALRRRTPATSCVEEAMIAANECVASCLNDRNECGVFRVHEPPASDSLVHFIPILQEFGYDSHIDMDAVASGSPFALQQVLERARARSEASLVSSLVLRAQQRAVYSDRCAGHYGLALEAYCHFTSPIRRYPDLIMHRMLASVLEGRSSTYTAQCDSLSWIAEHSSKMERIAESAERESQEIKLVEYMASYIGCEFEGVVSGVATYGVFVELPNTVEGLIAVRFLGNEYFSFDPAAYRLTGQDTGRRFRLGQKLRVRVHAAPRHSRKLDLRLA